MLFFLITFLRRKRARGPFYCFQWVGLGSASLCRFSHQMNPCAFRKQSHVAQAESRQSDSLQRLAHEFRQRALCMSGVEIHNLPSKAIDFLAWGF